MKIVVVEDSLFVQKVLQRVIQDHIPGCEVYTASNGEMGYSLYLEHQPDVVTTDLLMPDLSGDELLKRIREKDMKTRVIVISADVQRATRDELEQFGISGFINKPVTADKAELLIRLIKEAPHAE